MGWSELQLQVRDECLRLLDLALAECTDARSALQRTLSLLDAEVAVSREGFIASAGGTDVNKVIMWQPA